MGKGNRNKAKRHNKRTRLDDMGSVGCICPDNDPFTDWTWSESNSGYNTASPQKREKYNEKKLCRVVGMGMLVITLLILIMAIGQNTLPAAMAYVFGAITLLNCAVMMILANSICKK